MRGIVVFDLGGVLIDWNPRYLYRKLFDGDDAAMEHFLSTVCTMEWHLRHDAGELFADTRGELKKRHPQFAGMIDAFGQRHMEMFAGAIEETVDILRRLAARRVPLYALTNFPAETFVRAREDFDFLELFRDIVVSGIERVVKPDPRIFEILLTRNRIDPGNTVYIDDNERNVEASRALGMHGIHFRSSAGLEKELVALKLLDTASSG